MKGNALKGAGYFLEGLRLIWRPGIRGFTLWPLLITLLVFAALVGVGIGQFDGLMNRVLPSGDNWWSETLRYLLWPLFALALLLVWYFLFTIVANFIGAPFNGLLAERVEHHLRGTSAPESGSLQLIREIIPALLNEVVKYSYFLVLALPLLLLSLIPVLNLAAPFLWLVFMAWVLGLEYTEYPMDNNGLRFRQVREQLRRRRLTSLGFGGMALLCTFVPGLNLLVMPAAVAGGTVFWVRELQP